VTRSGGWALLAMLLGALAAGRPAGLPAPRRARPLLRIVADVPLPGPPVRFDHQSFDLSKNRLYITHMGAGTVVVFDVQQRRAVRTIGGLPGATGVRAVPSLGRVYVSVTDGHHVAVIDEASYGIVARVGEIDAPDAIGFAPEQAKLYVSDRSGGGELVLDGRTNRVVRRLDLGGVTGDALFDPGSRCMLIAVQSTNQLAVIDPASDRVLGRFPLAGATRPHALAIDAVRRRAFVADEHEGRLLIVDLKTMAVIGTADVGDDPDVVAFDPLWRRLYVASEAGVISVFNETTVGLSHEGDVTMPFAHTVAVDPRTHLLYVPLMDVGGRPVLRIMEAVPPPSR
jgi:DNA-binding beta-propeller fold protein YncE